MINLFFKVAKVQLTVLMILISTMPGRSEQRTGSLENTISHLSTPILYFNTKTVILNTYQEVYRVTTTGGKQLYEITLVHYQDANKINCHIEPSGIFDPQVKEYDPIRSGLFFSNKSDLDTNVSVMAKYDDTYSFICSFGDTVRYGHNYRKDPFLHKIKVGEGLFLILDPISPKRIDRHKEYVYRAIEQINFEAKKKTEEEEISRRQEESHRQDSLLQVNTQRAIKRTQDSLSTEHFIKILLEDAEAFYQNWREDTDLVAQLQLKILKRYQEVEQSLEATRIEGELYAGDKRHRRKQGLGFSVLKEGTLRDGYFNQDTFVSGKAILWEKDKSYVGEVSEGKRNGLGMLKRTDGNYLLGHFEAGEFADGISSWTSDRGNWKHFFGFYSYGEPNGYGELSYRNDSLYVGIFKKGVLITGYIKLSTAGKIEFYQVDKGVVQLVDSWVGNRFLEELDKIKRRSVQISKVIYEDKVIPLKDAPKDSQKIRYKVPNYFGCTLGAVIPAFGFENDPCYGGVGPSVSIDAWFRFANAIGLRIKISGNAYTVRQDYSDNFNNLHNPLKIPYKSEMLWASHSYDIGLGLNLGRKVASLELAALAGMSVVHQPEYSLISTKVSMLNGKASWNFISEAALRFNCTKRFGLRFGATYFLTTLSSFKGYAVINSQGLEDWNNDGTPGDEKKILIHSFNPFISFLGLF